MKILFYHTKDGGSEAALAQKHLKNLGVTLWSQSETAAGKTDGGLAQVEAIVVLGRQLDAQAGYLIALGLSQNKPVLYLLPAGQEPDQAIKNLAPNKNVASRLTISHFQTANLAEQLADWLQKLDTSTLTEYYNIKYTLRVSRKLAEYLNWKSTQSGSKKADWIRDFIRELMEKDSAYQKYLQGKFKLRR